MSQDSTEAVLFPARFKPALSSLDQKRFEKRWRKNRAWILCSMAHLAYHNKEKITELMARFEATTSFYDQNGAQAFLASWTDRAVLAFRGTQVDEKTAKANPAAFSIFKELLGVDLDADMMAFLSNDVASDLQFTKTDFDGRHDVRVHRGFLEELDKIWPSHILPDLKKLATNIPVSVTGHSLGGAMSMLAGMRYAFEEVVTFGEPRVGRNLGIVFKAKSHVRYANGDDPVPKVPPTLFRYEHHGTEQKIRAADGKSDFRFDHAIPYYNENMP